MNGDLNVHTTVNRIPQVPAVSMAGFRSPHGFLRFTTVMPVGSVRVPRSLIRLRWAAELDYVSRVIDSRHMSEDATRPTATSRITWSSTPRPVRGTGSSRPLPAAGVAAPEG